MQRAVCRRSYQAKDKGSLSLDPLHHPCACKLLDGSVDRDPADIKLLGELRFRWNPVTGQKDAVFNLLQDIILYLNIFWYVRNIIFGYHQLSPLSSLSCYSGTEDVKAQYVKAG